MRWTTVAVVAVIAAGCSELPLVTAGSGVGLGIALEHARAMVAAAASTLDQLADRGWRMVAGDGPGGGRALHDRDAVTERTEPFDPFGTSLA